MKIQLKNSLKYVDCNVEKGPNISQSFRPNIKQLYGVKAQRYSTKNVKTLYIKRRYKSYITYINLIIPLF